MKFKGEVFEGTHEPLISKKLFDTCQEVMSKRGKVQEVRKHEFAFLGLMKCASCGCSITAEIQKGHNYYRCTKKKGGCQEKHYLREELLNEQIKSSLQKVSLSSQDTEKVLAALETQQEQTKQQAKSETESLKKQLNQLETKLVKLLELSWLEPAREFVLSLNQAAKIAATENKKEMTTFLKNIGSNHILQNRQLIFSPKIPYNLIAEQSKTSQQNLTFPYWCRGAESNCHGAFFRRVS